MTKSPKVRNLSPMRTLRFLLQSHYLADDFPTVITTANFAGFCAKNYASLPPLSALLQRTTLYGTFSVPRTSTSRRVMALPHPASQLALSVILTDHQRDVRSTIAQSKFTLYRAEPDAKHDRAFGGINFAFREVEETAILARYPVVVKADIANFFHTIYSHSLPWAALGKQVVKAIREGKDKKAKKDLEQHWASKIDLAIQRGNSRETFGIPVGPDTSRIIAEILLAGVQKVSPLADLIATQRGYRLVDDFFIGFDDELAARRCQDALRQVLWEYNLQLNEPKTQIVRSNAMFDAGWKFEIDTFRIPSASASKQYDAIQRLLDIALHHCAARQDWYPALFFCNRLAALQIKPQNFSHILNCMLRIGRDFPMCLKTVARFLIGYRNVVLANSVFRELITEWARQLLGSHARRGHDFEVAWVLVICGVLGFSVDQKFMGLEALGASPVVLSILGLLSTDQLLKEKWDSWNVPPPGSGSIAEGRYWLPHYEAVLRKWTHNSEIQKEISKDPLFSKLLAANVTFLDDADFLSKAAELPKPPPDTGKIVKRMETRTMRFLPVLGYD